jgi:pimeloyl-ACP methyl ester carboxylesterase
MGNGYLLRGMGPRLAIVAAALVSLDADFACAQSIQNPMVPVPIPAQAPVKEGTAAIADTHLWYWDTGGDGVPIVLLHPASGSGLIWSYQQPVLAKASYRVIAYSRRGHYNSDPVVKGKAGIGSEDLQALVDLLGLKKFHLLGSAAGGSVASDYALSHPDRLLSLIIADNSAGVRDGDVAQAVANMRAKGFEEMPVEFRELGPSYRAANPEGTRQWVELARKATVGGDEPRQATANAITTAKIEGIKVPTLLITGDADLSTPPSTLRLVAHHIAGSEMVIVPESGHSVYWEQPETFNRAVLGFIGKHAN